MNRQTAVICLAKLNRYSKQINSKIELEQPMDFKILTPEIYDVRDWGNDILSFVSSNPSYEVVREMDIIHDVSNIQAYLKSTKLPTATKIPLMEFTATVVKLKEYAEDYMKSYRKGPYEKLVDELASEKGKELFLKMKEAGFVDDDFKLTKSVNRIQTKILAWVAITKLKLPKKKSWSILERQWECCRLGNIPVPEQKTRDIDKIRTVFPELDYSTLFPEPTEKFFKVKCSNEVLLEVFLALVTNGFISKRTKFENFQKIFGIGDTENMKPIEWKKTLRMLVHFVHHSFSKTNAKYLEATRNCFVINGKELNKGTLKSSTCYVKHSGRFDDQLTGLNAIAAKLADWGEEYK